MARFNFLTLALVFAATPLVVATQKQLRHLQTETAIAESVDAIVTGDSELTTLAAALTAAGLVGVLCPDCNFTLFAPTDEAFAAVDQDFLTKLLTPSWITHLTNILSFHATKSTTARVTSSDLSDGLVLGMLNEENVTVNIDGAAVTITSEFTESAPVVQADLLANNGVVHKVSSVLLPAFAVTDLAGLASTPVGAGFTILYELLGRAGIVPDNCTVFAPTDAAFEALDSATLDALRQESGKELLTSILVNHVVSGVVPSVLVTDGLTSPTRGELSLTFSVEAGTVMVNDATIVAVDVLANNGIVHAIDKVLLMPETPTAPASNGTSTTPTASNGNATSGSGVMGSFEVVSVTLALAGAFFATM